jgi:hypothetical protein
VTPDIVFAMTAPPAVLGVIWIATIVRAAERAARAAVLAENEPAAHIPPPLTDAYVDQQFAALMWLLTHPELNP